MTDSYKLSCLALPCLALVRLDLPYLPGFTSVMVLVVVVVVMVMVMVMVMYLGNVLEEETRKSEGGYE